MNKHTTHTQGRTNKLNQAHRQRETMLVRQQDWWLLISVCVCVCQGEVGVVLVVVANSLRPPAAAEPLECSRRCQPHAPPHHLLLAHNPILTRASNRLRLSRVLGWRVEDSHAYSVSQAQNVTAHEYYKYEVQP